MSRAVCVSLLWYFVVWTAFKPRRVTVNVIVAVHVFNFSRVTPAKLTVVWLVSKVVAGVKPQGL